LQVRLVPQALLACSMLCSAGSWAYLCEL
jgi:hypothetical protein